jgi:hypothetical protein
VVELYTAEYQEDQSERIVAACAEYIALEKSGRIVVQSRALVPAERKTVWASEELHDVHMIAMSPLGDKLAYTWSSDQGGAVVSLPDGKTLFTFGQQDTTGDTRFFFFLHGGRYLHVSGEMCRLFDIEESSKSAGAQVKAQYSFKDADYHAGAAINEAGTLLATAAHRPNLIVVRELPSKKELARIEQGPGLPLGLTFDEASQQLFFMAHAGHMQTRSLSLPGFDKPRIWNESVGAQSVIACDDGLLLHNEDFKWIDKEGINPAWGWLMNAALPKGGTFQWKDRRVAGSPDEVLVPAPEGVRVIKIDTLKRFAKAGVVTVGGLEHVFAEVRQWNPAALADLRALMPFACNQRDSDGETFLHRIFSGLSGCPLRDWLGNGICYTPVANDHGATVLHMAIKQHDRISIRTLLTELTPCLHEEHGAMLCQALGLMAQNTPELVPWALELIEAKVLQTQRTVHSRARVHVRGSEHFKCSLPDDLWGDVATIDKSAIEMQSIVVNLRDLVGDPTRSPFAAIVENCGTQVYDTVIFEHAVLYKWNTNNVNRIHREIFIHVFYVVVVSFAMCASSTGLAKCEGWSHIDGGSEGGGDFLACLHLPWTTAVAAAAAIGIVLTSVQELHEAHMLGVRDYFSQIWNWIDLLSTLLSGIGLLGYATGDGWLIFNFGSLGVMMLWLGLLDAVS